MTEQAARAGVRKDAPAALELSSLTWTEAAAGPMVLVVPVGSCEQHGPHLPLDTDLRIATALARAALARATLDSAAVDSRDDAGAALGGRGAAVLVDAVLGPAVTIGASGEHQAFPGTLSIGTEVLVAVLVELARSALPPVGADVPRPFRAVRFVNGHGGNVEAFDRAIPLLLAEGRDVAVWHPKVPDGDSHAGRTETSLLLHLDPGCVRLDRIEPGSTARWREIGERVRAEGLAAVTPNGILGDPRVATAQEGAEVFDTLVADLRHWLDGTEG